MAKFSYTSDWTVSQYIASIKADVRARLVAAVGQLAPQVRSIAQSLAPHKSGRLAGAISSSTSSSKTRVMGYVGVSSGGGLGSVPYAHAVEAGFHGSESITGYYRTIKQAFGRPIKPMQIFVKAHSRNVNAPADGFLRNALDSSRSAIEGQISSAIDGIR